MQAARAQDGPRGEDSVKKAEAMRNPAIATQLTLRVFRFRKSIRMNWPSVIVLVKYALPRLISDTASRTPPAPGRARA